MTVVVHLKSGDSVIIDEFSHVIVRTNSPTEKPNYPKDKMELFDFCHGEQCNFVGSKSIVAISSEEILFVETKLN